MKRLLCILAVFVVLQSQSMCRDPRVWPQLKNLGLCDEHFGCIIPQVLPDGKKIYYAKGQVHGIERIVRVRYHANGALDISFGQGGVEIGEMIGHNVPMLQAINNSVEDLRN